MLCRFVIVKKGTIVVADRGENNIGTTWSAIDYQ